MENFHRHVVCRWIKIFYAQNILGIQNQLLIFLQESNHLSKETLRKVQKKKKYSSYVIQVHRNYLLEFSFTYFLDTFEISIFINIHYFFCTNEQYCKKSFLSLLRIFAIVCFEESHYFWYLLLIHVVMSCVLNTG